LEVTELTKINIGPEGLSLLDVSCSDKATTLAGDLLDIKKSRLFGGKGSNEGSLGINAARRQGD
jgi:hypothetical protein